MTIIPTKRGWVQAEHHINTVQHQLAQSRKPGNEHIDRALLEDMFIDSLVSLKNNAPRAFERLL